MTIGRMHSFESMGLVDGPGIRNVVFLQGCKLRCAYCHNPDTWNTKEGTNVDSLDLIEKIKRFKPYFDRSGGGVTFSGGEPLLQPEFLLEMLKLCKDSGINTAIDTAGVGFGDYDEILKYTDLVLLDLKHSTSEGYEKLTGRCDDDFKHFLDVLQKSGTKIWIRHVVVPGITDSKEHEKRLISIIKKLKNVEKVELLPYHTLGVYKYENMGINYRLRGVNPMDKSVTEKMQTEIRNAISK